MIHMQDLEAINLFLVDLSQFAKTQLVVRVYRCDRT